MATFNEVIYSVRERIRQHTDDSDIDNRQILFELNVQRGLVYRNEYNKNNRTIDDEAKQIVCVPMEYTTAEACGCNDDCKYLRSSIKLPTFIELHDKIAITHVKSVEIGSIPFSYVSYSKFPFVGKNKYNKNAVFVTLHPSGYLYVKSANPNFKLIEKVLVHGIFENPLEAAKLCDEANCPDDIFESQYPAKSYILAYILDIVTNVFINKLQVPKDLINNANEA